ncbi:MAG: type secretion system protein [Bryobacterales bacterium]|jgi:type VI secretion system protein|nr:type secretion system protein [Bryobacterales bacterium]
MLQQLSGIFIVSASIKARWRLGFCALLAIVLTSACAKRQLTIKVGITAGANGNNPVALDLVSVTDKDLGKEISKLTAADWFQKREQYLRDYSKPGVLNVTSGEWVPGQPVPSLQLPAPFPIALPIISSSATVLVFANYFSPGPHRAKLQPNKLTTIRLGEDDLTVFTGSK